MKNLILVFACLLSTTLWAQSSKEVYEMAQEGKAIIVDVREENEIADGMVKGAKWFPLSKINQDKNWDQEFKKMTGEKKVFVYCRSGGRAGRVKGMLHDKGTESVNFGGFMTLQNELPTQKGK